MPGSRARKMPAATLNTLFLGEREKPPLPLSTTQRGVCIKGYWDYRGWTAFLILAGTLAAGWLGAAAGKVFLARTR